MLPTIIQVIYLMASIILTVIITITDSCKNKDDKDDKSVPQNKCMDVFFVLILRVIALISINSDNVNANGGGSKENRVRHQGFIENEIDDCIPCLPCLRASNLISVL